MDSIKVAENLAAGSVVKEVQIILENGGEANYSIALVSGKFAIDNAKFSFDVDGNIINNNILASGIYWIRYRATVGFNSVEKGLKIYTDDQEVEITLSDTEYEYDITTDGVVAIVSLSSGSTEDVTITPQSDIDDSGLPAFTYDGPSGEIRWSGDQSPLEYTYNIQYTGACIKPILNQEFTVVGALEVDDAFTVNVSVSSPQTWTQAYAAFDAASLVEVELPADNGLVYAKVRTSSGGNRQVAGSGRKVPATPGATMLRVSTGYQRYPGAGPERMAIIYHQGVLPTVGAGLKSWTLYTYVSPSSGSNTVNLDAILPSLDLNQEFFIAYVSAKWFDGTGADFSGSNGSVGCQWNISSVSIS